MAHNAGFILEIGVEELPIHDQAELVENLQLNLHAQLNEHAIEFAGSKVFSAPRRLAVLIDQISIQSHAQSVNKRGPLVNLDNTVNAEAFAKSLGITVNELSQIESGKGLYWHYQQQLPGINTFEVLPALIHNAVDKLNVKKRMRWASQAKGFVRPVHWILAKFGSKVIPVTIFEISADRYTHGHRFHRPQQILVEHIADYQQILAEHYVIAERALRQEKILQQLHELAEAQNAIPVINEDLLKIVTNLTEWPVALCAKFNPEFLRVPKECLISAMQHHQKCFALIDKHGSLLPNFLLISNINSTQPQVVIAGNELVMNARLQDAAFHFELDQQQTLSSRVAKLQEIAFDQKLGSVFDKTVRIAKLAHVIAQQLNWDTSNIAAASALCKADLTTNMVGEFPELQGIMGKYYAALDAVDPKICQAIEEHYWPQNAADKLPNSQLATCLALADRLDTLSGMLSVGKGPTGEKDPYGLRRQAQAVMRIIVEQQLPLDLQTLFASALANLPYNPQNPELIVTLITFCFERLKNLLLKNDHTSVNEFNAVLHDNLSKPYDFMRRLQAVRQFKDLEQAASLAAANKRVKNLLSKASDYRHSPIKIKLLQEPAEKQLYHKILQIQQDIKPLLQQQDYAAILITLASLGSAIDNFFNDVLINVDNPELKHNRLTLLKMIRDLFLEVADISAL